MRLWLLRLLLRMVDRRLRDIEYELLLYEQHEIVLLPGELRWLLGEVPRLQARRASLIAHIAIAQVRVEGQV